jgi:ribosomal protein L37AE/L43A
MDLVGWREIGNVIGILIWIAVSVAWFYSRSRGGIKSLFARPGVRVAKPTRTRTAGRTVKMPAWVTGLFRRKKQPTSSGSKDYQTMVSQVESICARDRINASDAAAMVESVKKLTEIEPASGQIWEAFALESLESAEITCDDCGVLVEKTVKRTGVKIECPKCKKWLALKNSKVTVVNPGPASLEDWER